MYFLFNYTEKKWSFNMKRSQVQHLQINYIKQVYIYIINTE